MNHIKFLIPIIIMTVLTGCGKNGATYSMNADEIFPNQLFSQTSEVIYQAFDGTQIEIDNSETIKALVGVLEKTDYQNIEESKYVEGLYSFDFVLKDGTTFAVGMSENIIAVEGKQYQAKENVTEIFISEFGVN